MKLQTKDQLIFLALLMCLLAPIAWGATWLVQKHQWAQGRLAEIEPRYARLLGVQAQEQDIQQARQSAQAAVAQYLYPATQDATQAGNLAQQRIRDVLSAAGLQIISSQVLAAKTDKAFDQIPLTIRAEGDFLALQSALAVLSSQTPLVLISEMDVQVQGGLINISPTLAPRLSVQFNLSVLKERS